MDRSPCEDRRAADTSTLRISSKERRPRGVSGEQGPRPKARGCEQSRITASGRNVATQGRCSLRRGAAIRIVARVPGSRRPLNTRVAAHEPPAVRRLRHNAASRSGPAPLTGIEAAAQTAGTAEAAIKTRASASRPRLPSRVARRSGRRWVDAETPRAHPSTGRMRPAGSRLRTPERKHASRSQRSDRSAFPKNRRTKKAPPAAGLFSERRRATS